MKLEKNGMCYESIIATFATDFKECDLGVERKLWVWRDNAEKKWGGACDVEEEGTGGEIYVWKCMATKSFLEGVFFLIGLIVRVL